MHILYPLATSYLSLRTSWDEQLLNWATSVKAIYDEAVAWVEQGPDPHASPRMQKLVRVAQQHAFEQRLWQVCAPYVNTSTPMQTRGHAR